MAKCALCDEHALGRRDEHLLFECTDQRVVEVRKQVEGVVRELYRRRSIGL